jgi:predicted CoA-binding protein
MKATKAAIDLFFQQKRIAVAGVSRRRAHFSRIVFSALRERGYDAVPVNPAGGEIDGLAAAASLGEVSPPPGAVLVLTARVGAPIVAQAAAAGARVLWLYRRPAFAIGPPVPGLEIVAGECPLMFMPDTGWIHAAHRGLRAVFGQLPS